MAFSFCGTVVMVEQMFTCDELLNVCPLLLLLLLLLSLSLLLLLLLLLYDMDVSCHRPFLPGTSLEPAVGITAQASSFTLQYFLYYV